MKCAQSAPPIAERKTLNVHAHQRANAAFTPSVSAASSSSRDALSFRPSDDSLKAKATTTLREAQTKAFQRPVYFGTPKTVVAPLVSCVHCRATRLITIKKAKVAIVKEAPRRRTK